MTDTTTPQAGMPCWIDITVLDVDAAKNFYGQLFGWEFGESNEQFGGYAQIFKDGKAVAGLNPMAENMTVNVWTVHIATDDIDKTAELITSSGGSLIAEPMAVGDLGKLLIAADTTGAVFGAWQSEQFKGAELFNQPGALIWEDLRSKDPSKAREFYKAVFGYDYHDMDMANADYKTFAHAGSDRPLGGMGDMMGAPDSLPSHWIVYIMCEDTPSALTKAKELGGSVTVDTMQLPWGRMAGLVDPNGGAFLIMDGVTA